MCLLAEVTVEISGLYSNAISPSHLLFSHIFNYNQVKPTVLWTDVINAWCFFMQVNFV